MKISIPDIMATDLTPHLWRVSEPWALEYMQATTGQHYKLCAYLAGLFPGRPIVDAGTAEGTSAIAFASRGNPVTTCDVGDRRRWDLSGLPITFHGCGLNDPPIRKAALESPLIMIDIDHHSIEERRFCDWLSEIGWRGIVLVDDICDPGSPHPMRLWWDSIDLPKHDITKWCHWSGSGLIDYGIGLEIEVPSC